MANDVVDGCANGFREASIVERCRNSALVLGDELMANPVQFVGGNARDDMLTYHVEDVGCQTAGNTHSVLLIRRFYRYIHRDISILREMGSEPFLRKGL